jgi:hypothetical protein
MYGVMNPVFNSHDSTVISIHGFTGRASFEYMGYLFSSPKNLGFSPSTRFVFPQAPMSVECNEECKEETKVPVNEWFDYTNYLDFDVCDLEIDTDEECIAKTYQSAD